MKFEIYGSGCHKCAEMEKRTKDAIEVTGRAADVEHVYDMGKIVAKGIYITPALALDGKVIASGKTPSVDEIVAIIKGAS